MPIVAFLSVGSPDAMASRVNALSKGLGETGYAKGRNVEVEYHWLEGQYEQLAMVLGDLIQRHVAVMAIPGSTLYRSPPNQRPTPSRLCSAWRKTP
jgi:putative ABC transport system substrate-binding protein